MARVVCASLFAAAGLAPAAEPDVIPLPAGAAPAASADAPASDAQPAARLPEVLVTANKKEEVLRDIPASIAALGGEQIERSGAQGIDDFLKLVPGVNIIPNEPGAVKVTIRGISSELGTNSTTGTLFGNVSFNDAYFPFVSLDPNPFDLNDVEVLKGPQGTLYGASALNGAVRYVPRRPQFDAFELKYFAQYTQVNEGGGAPIYGAAVNLPAGHDQDMALRLVGFKHRAPGYIDDTGRNLADVNKISQYGLRGMFEWQALQRWNVSLMYSRQNTDFADEPFADNREGRLTRSDTPATSPKASFYDLGDVALQYDFDGASLTSETALVRKHFTESPDISRLATGTASMPVIATTIFFNSQTRTQELRLASPKGGTGPWSWVGGGFWSDQPIDSGYDIFSAPGLPAGTPVAVPDLSALGGGSPLGNAFITTNGQPILGHQRSNVTVRELALFADVTRELWHDWHASLGLRAYRTTSGGTARASGALYGGVENVNQGQLREQGLNPKASLRWQASQHLQTYALVSRGFRVGGIQPTASKLSTSIPTVFKSDTIWNYEAGVRTQWLDDMLRIDLTGFHEKWNQPQLAQRDPSNPNPVATYYDNVGGAKSDGAEAALQWRTPLDGLSASVSAAYVRTVTTVPFTTGAGVATTPGTTWPYAPKWQTASVLSYLHPLWGSWDVNAAFTHTLISRAYTTLANNIAVFDYQQFDVQLGLADSALKWPELTLSLTNLLDTRGINQDALTGPAHDVIYVRPRAITLHLGGKF